MFTNIKWTTIKRFNSQWRQLAQCYEKLPEKLSLLLQDEEGTRRTIRCGVILPRRQETNHSEFISALLSDVYARDQTWFRTLVTRYHGKNVSNVLMRYGQQLDLLKSERSIMLTLPSPFLKRYDVEFLEFHDNERPEYERGCHLYVDLGDSPSRVWPTISINDTKISKELLLSSSVNAKLALKATIDFVRDKSTVDEYLRNMETSNFDNISKRLGSILEDKETIFKNLQKSIIENIKRTELPLERKKMIEYERKQMMSEIESWSQLAHLELQTVINPLLDQFSREHLSIWKIYTYSESKLKLNLLELLVEPLTHLKMKSSLFKLSGKLQLDDTLALKSPLEIQNIGQRVLKLHGKANKAIYQNFFSLQLPLILCSVVGGLSEQFSFYSMGSLASFGIVLGFKRVMSYWDETMKSLQQDIIANIRENIEKDKAMLVASGRERFSEKEFKLDQKIKIIDSLPNELKK
ncbi:hypothetical protein HG535_0G03620 [Zygotorulaspora mrakii]|uniref:Mmc1 C-terminal domain-containing protein n=1 Tax=Zygotorulaspora mrakii TaxID=42260 RepID=A0A7H9B905_ZYGMR|nr:uncharacterized protein HG535_0G03620 [Zygotorulaspora mrakii]QLG74479.1 hypothetical protein HG535_0G03620 [Zygotorulaspora mrakii]